MMTNEERINMMYKRISVLKARGETMNAGIINKIMRKIRMLDK